jgi:acyl carrier protein
MTQEDAIVLRLRALVDETLISTDQEPPEGPLQMDAFLPEILDSIALTALIARIEEEWDLEIEDEEIEPAIFENLEVLATFIKGKLNL